MPNLVPSEKRICLTRIRWEKGEVGTSDTRRGYSAKLSLSLCFVPRDAWIGAFWKRVSIFEWCMWVCLIPCFPLRIKLVKSWGGIYP